MFRNLFTVSVRNLFQNRSYTALHILGLTLGLTCALFIAVYVIDELSYDKLHEKNDRIYRVITKTQQDGKEAHYATTQVPLAVELETKYSNVENAIRFVGVGRELFEVPDRKLQFYETDIYYTDPEVFDVFSFPLISGDPKTALVEPNTAVVTEETALRYFGTTDAIGKTFKEVNWTFTVTGVAQNVPLNSSIQFDALLSFATHPPDFGNWLSWYPDLYVLLAEGRTTKDVDADLAAIVKEHLAETFKGAGIDVSYWLQPITDIHLKSGFEVEGGDPYDYIYIFLSIGVFVIILACINYINLATARAAKRAKEIGIRKTIGSTKGNIIVQFVSESMLLAIISTLLAVGLVILTLPYFNEFSGKSIGSAYLTEPLVVVCLITLILFIGVVGGSYPAFYLSRFNPVLVLKGNITRGAGNANLRKVLVSVQFAISIAMLICTSIVYDQLSFMRNRDLGFSRDQVLHLELADFPTMSNADALQQKLKDHSQIVSLATSSSMPGRGIDNVVMTVETNEGFKPQPVTMHSAGWDYATTMGLTIVEGRNFSRDFITDSVAVLVNESFVKQMNWKDPIGKRFVIEDGVEDNPLKYRTVVGVVKDYHQHSLHSSIFPMAILHKEPDYFLNIKLHTQDISGTIKFIEQVWNEVTDGKPFSYTFLDQTYERQYEADQKRGQIFSMFSMICLVISCVGLFGLAAYTTEQRAKEIGIRKVVGASIPSIVKLFYSDFLKLVVVGLVIAFPASWYLMSSWQQTFAYQVGLNWVNFVGSAIATITIVLGSISFYAIRSAMLNPASVLKAE